MTINRRTFITGTAAAALAGSGVYGLIESLARSPQRVALGSVRLSAQALPVEQHLVLGTETVVDQGVSVLVPPLHHMVVTARVQGVSGLGGPDGGTASGTSLSEAQSVLETTLAGLESSGLLDFTPNGLALAVAWGQSYFSALPDGLMGRYMPVDRRASGPGRRPTPVLLQSPAFPSDPAGLILEQNDVAFIFNSDSLDHVDSASAAIFSGPAGELLEVTSVRRGFVDGRYVGTGTQSLTKQMAVQAGVPGADAIPDSAELFFGFTSTQTQALGSSVIANLEALPGITDQWPDGYFLGGTTMHLSHIFEDLVGWYGAPYRGRAGAAFSPAAGGSARPGTQTVAEGPANVDTERAVAQDVAQRGFTGHSASLQPESRLASATVDNYGSSHAAGTPVPIRRDFNTLDNPFQYSSDPQLDRVQAGAAAGLHFVAYTPTSDTFHRIRYAMDGQYPDGTNLGPRVVHGPFNRFLHTTHRQNFLVPPRAHRSFPLAELA